MHIERVILIKGGLWKGERKMWEKGGGVNCSFCFSMVDKEAVYCCGMVDKLAVDDVVWYIS